MFEQISFQNNADKKQEKLKKEIVFPHAESILRSFRDKYKNEPEKAGIMENILYEFFEQEIENIEIYESEKFGASFPWTVIQTKELTKKIIKKYSDRNKLKELLTKLTENDEVAKQEFIFSSGSIMKSGYPFTFVEEAMHQAVVALKSNLLALREGREINDQEIYTIGLPTNELGKISPEFLEKLKADPFGVMGELQAEFVQSHIPKNENDARRLNIKLYGISTGASLAAATGEKLVADGVVSQNLENKGQDMPRLSVRMDSPVGLSKSTTKNWQIPLGYVAEFVYQTFKDPKFRLSDPKFMNQVKQALGKRGIIENMTASDKQMKTEAISAIISKLKEGVDFDKDLKVTKVTGTSDPLTFSLKEYRAEKAHQAESAGTLGANISPRNEENRREFAINQTHTPAFFRDSELKRYYETARLIQELKEVV